MWFNRCLLAFVLCFAVQSFAQNEIDSILSADTIYTVNVSDYRVYQQGFTTSVQEDEIALQAKSLAQVLGNQASVFIKNYGPGQLASVSINGLNATQTNITWNGLRLNSSMLGQSDLSLLPIFETNEVTLESVPNNLGGNFAIRNALDASPGTSGRLSWRAGSFANFGGSGSISHAKSGFVSNTSIQLHSGKNNFKYFNPFLPSKEKTRLENAEVMQFSLSQSLAYYWSQSSIKWHYLQQESNRNLPPTIVETNSSENQKDRLNAAVLQFSSLLKGGSKINIQTGYQRQRIAFQLASTSTSDISIAQSWQNDLALEYSIPKYWLKLKHKVQHIYETGEIAAYNGSQKRNNMLFLTDAIVKWNRNHSIKAGWAVNIGNDAFNPILPSFRYTWKLDNLPSNLLLSASYNKHFRLPTLNDLYWNPGGNPNLMPENSHQFNMEMELKDALNAQKFRYEFKAQIFHIWADNYIQWQPNNSGIWSPSNVSEVFSRGTQIGLKLERRIGWRSELGSSVSYSYTRTNSMQNNQRQLLYVPKQQVNWEPHYQWRSWRISMPQQFVGSVFTNTSGNQILDQYYLVNASISGRFTKFKKENSPDLVIGLAANNLGNKEYQSVVNRVLPGRNYAINLQLIWKK